MKAGAATVGGANERRIEVKSFGNGDNGIDGNQGRALAKMLAIIKSHPGIRPSELNRRLKMIQSDALRDALIRRGLVRKVKDGPATHLYAK